MQLKKIKWVLMGTLISLIISYPCLAGANAANIGRIELKDYAWWRQARFGIFIHWNTSSVLALGAGSWRRSGNPKRGQAGINQTDFHTPFVIKDETMKKYWGIWGKHAPQSIYDNMFKVFNPVDFDADLWAKTFKEAGAGYVVFTAKHHDGFCMFDSKLTQYDVMSTPFKRDICKELVDACEKVGLKVIWYYSVTDWYDQRYDPKNPKAYEDYLVGQIDELFAMSKNVAGVWWDRGGTKIDPMRVWRTIKKYCDNPIANTRGIRLPGMLFNTPEQKLGNFDMKKPWESCVTMQGEGWFWNGGRNMMSENACIRLLVDAAGGDGNLLLDFGPTEKGTINPGVRKNYLSMGRWLKKYGQSIYGTRGGPYLPGHWGVATRKDHTVYLHITQQWRDGLLELPKLGAKIVDYQVLTGGKAVLRQTKTGLRIELNDKYHRSVSTIIAIKIDRPALALKMITHQKDQSLTRDAKVSTSSIYHVGNSSRGEPGSVVVYQCEMDKKGKRFKKGSKGYVQMTKKRRFLGLRRGHIWRFWMARGQDKKPWIELDLKEMKTFQRINLFEKFSRIQSWEIQIIRKGNWSVIAQGKELDHLSIKLPKAVTAQRIRLVINSFRSDKAEQGPGIREFDLFVK